MGEEVLIKFKEDIDGFQAAGKILNEIYGNQFLLLPSSMYYNLSFLDKLDETQIDGLYLDSLQLVLRVLESNEELNKLQESPYITDVFREVKWKLEKIEPDFATKPNNWGIKRLQVENAQKTGEGVRVAVLDTGIDLSHPAFSSIPEFRTINLVKPQKTVQDKHGHGTHVAGIITDGRGDDPKKRYSVAPDVDLFVAKVLTDKGNIYKSSTIGKGVDWSIQMNCRIINISIGIPVNENQPVDKGLQEIITRAYLNNVNVVAGVGNGSDRSSADPSEHNLNPIDAPSNCKHVLAISAIDSSNRIYVNANSSKNKDQNVDFVAPGVGIYSTFPIRLSPKGYAFLDGTSMAAPFITGLLALYFQENPESNADDAEKYLTQVTQLTDLEKDDVGRGLPIYMG